MDWAMYDDPEYDWGLQTVPQEHLNDRVIPQQRGKVLGGSSSLLQLQHVYSSEPAIDAWEKMGNLGWYWKTILPYLKKFHTHHPPSPDDLINEIQKTASFDDAVESLEGPVQTSYSQTSEVDKDWYQSWKGIMTNLGYHGKDIGGLVLPSAIDFRTKTRSYAGSTFYSTDISSRSNLRFVTEALAEKVIFDKGRLGAKITIT